MTDTSSTEPAVSGVSGDRHSTWAVDFEGTGDADLRATIDHAVAYHAPTDEARRRHEALRRHTRIFADFLVQLCPESPERDTAVWVVANEVLFYANAAVARHHDLLEPPLEDRVLAAPAPASPTDEDGRSPDVVLYGEDGFDAGGPIVTDDQPPPEVDDCPAGPGRSRCTEA